MFHTHAPQQRGIFGRRRLVADACEFHKKPKGQVLLDHEVKKLDAIVFMGEFRNLLAGGVLL